MKKFYAIDPLFSDYGKIEIARLKSGCYCHFCRLLQTIGCNIQVPWILSEFYLLKSAEVDPFSGSFFRMIIVLLIASTFWILMRCSNGEIIWISSSSRSGSSTKSIYSFNNYFDFGSCHLRIMVIGILWLGGIITNGSASILVMGLFCGLIWKLGINELLKLIFAGGFLRNGFLQLLYFGFSKKLVI